MRDDLSHFLLLYHSIVGTIACKKDHPIDLSLDGMVFSLAGLAINLSEASQQDRRKLVMLESRVPTGFIEMPDRVLQSIPCIKPLLFIKRPNDFTTWPYQLLVDRNDFRKHPRSS